jgi:hypothetical protein
MGCKTIPEQLAEALQKSAMNNTDELAVVVNGTLYSVSFGDLATQMGLTGALESLGNSGTPVLTGTAPDYKIAKLLGSQGVQVSTNGDGSVALKALLADAGAASDGSPIIKDRTATTIALKRLRAGNGISITNESNRLTIENTEVAVSNNTVIVSEISDLPTAVGGVITLEDNKDYLFVSDVTTSNRFVLGADTVVRAVDPFTVTLTYTGTGVMFTCPNGRQGIKEISISCANGTVFGGSPGVIGNLLVRFVYFNSVKHFGTIYKPFFGLFDCLIITHTGQGFSWPTGATEQRLRMNNINVLNTTSATMTFLDLQDAVFNSFDIRSVIFQDTVPGQTFLSGVAAGANMSGQTIGYVNNVSIQGLMAMLDTITTDEAGWNFGECNKIPDTNPHSLLYLSAAANTTIATASTPVVVNGTFTSEAAQVFTNNVNGRATYIGKRSAFKSLSLTISLEPVSGTGKDLAVYFAKNGAVIAATKVNRTSSSGSSAVVNVDWGAELVTNDYIEVFVANDTDSTSILVNQMLLRVA